MDRVQHYLNLLHTGKTCCKGFTYSVRMNGSTWFMYKTAPNGSAIGKIAGSLTDAILLALDSIY